MGSVKFLGIVFRSQSHMEWFQMSMTFLVISLIWYLAALVLSKRSQVVFFTPGMLWVMFLGFHVMTMAEALAVVSVRFFKGVPLNGKMFSVDCIWFNALMAFIYVLLFLIVRKSSKKSLGEIFIFKGG